jgi:hypothetical protein
MRFELDWIAGHSEQSVPTEALTRCHLALRVNGHQLLRHEDLLGERQVKDAITVSAYPLALWFAANWWRLRWEPNLTTCDESSFHDWQMSHVLAAAGEGYAWPHLTFSSDGENIQLNLKAGRANNEAPLRYLERLEAWIPADEYEAGVDNLINQTLERLSGSTGPTQLRELWQTVLEERASPSIALERQLEAKLGYDPEEAPASLITLLRGLAAEHGEGAVQELACLGHRNAKKAIRDAQQNLAESGELIKLPMRNARRLASILGDGNPGQPWQKGRDVANTARQHLGINRGPLNNRNLSELLETSAQFLEGTQAGQRLPIGLGEVTATGRTRVALGKMRKDSRRFMAARLIADGIYAGETGNWLPCTDAATARQKFQRAFAQEFLCPYDDLIEWMNTTSPDEETMEAAADHFEVSPLLINTVMVNRGHIPRSDLEAFQQAV